MATDEPKEPGETQKFLSKHWPGVGVDFVQGFGVGYRKDAPPDRAMLASASGEVTVILAHIGPALDYWIDEVSHHMDGLVDGPGIWIWEGSINCWMGEDVDLHTQSCRLATEEEVQAHIDGDWPWDQTLWHLLEDDEVAGD